MGDGGSTIGSCRNFANGEVGIGHRIAVVEGEHQLRAGRDFAVDTHIEWGWCRAIAFGTCAVATGAHVDDRFEINVDVVEQIRRAATRLNPIEPEVADAAEVAGDGVGAIDTYPILLGGCLDFVAGIAGVLAVGQTDRGRAATAAEGIDPLDDDSAIRVVVF